MTRLSLNNLLPNTSYAIRLRAVGVNDVSEWSTRHLFTTTSDNVLPSTPGSVSFISTGDSFHGEWNAVGTNVNGDVIPITRYEVELVGGGVSKVDSVTASTGSKVLYDLSFEANRVFFGSPKGTVAMRVRAVDNKELKSAWTDFVNASNPRPANITNVSGSVGVDQITLKWDAVADNDLARYEVYVGTNAGFTPASTNRVFSGLATTMSYTASSYVDHYFKVRAVDKFEQTSLSDTTSAALRPVSPFIVDATPPGMPTSANVGTSYDAVRKEAFLDVSWVAPSDTDLQNYTVRYGQAAGGPWNYITTDKDATFIRIPVVPGLGYYSNVRAVDYTGNVSSWATVANSPIVAGADTNAPVQPTSVSVVSKGTSFVLTWAPNPDNDLKEYQVSADDFGGNVVYYKVPTNRFDFTLEHQKAAYGSPRPNIGFRVQAIDVGGLAGPWSGAVNANNAAPAAPTALSVTTGANSLTARWTAPVADDLIGYNVYQGTAANPTTKVAFIDGTSYATSVNTTAQYFTIKAVDAFNQESAALSGGPFTATNPFLVDTVAPAVPGSLAANLSNNANGVGSKALVSWTLGSETDRQFVELSYKRAADTSWTSMVLGKDQLNASVELASANTAYDFRVRAADNSGNASGWTATLSKAAIGATTPAVPTGLSATPGKDSIVWRWNANTETDLKNYEVVFSTTSGFTGGTTTTFYTGTSNTLTVSGLNPTTTYYAQVRATNQANISSLMSAVVSSTTGTFPLTPLSDGLAPAVPGAAVLTAGIGYISATWPAVTTNASGGAQKTPVTYDVHLSTNAGFTPSAGTKVTETTGNFALVDALPGTTTPLAYGATYYVKLLAKDVDATNAGASPASNGAVPHQATSSDLNVSIGGGNLARDSDFSSGNFTSGWYIQTGVQNPGDIIQFVTESNGNKRLRLESASATDIVSVAQDQIIVTPNSKVTFSIWVQGANAAPMFTIFAKLPDNSSQTVLHDGYGDINPVPVDNGWAVNRYVKTVTVPAGYTKLLFDLRLRATGAAYMYVDKVQIEEGDIATAYSPNPKDVVDTLERDVVTPGLNNRPTTSVVDGKLDTLLTTANTSADSKITNYDSVTVQPQLNIRPTTTVVDGKVQTSLDAAKNYANSIETGAVNIFDGGAAERLGNGRFYEIKTAGPLAPYVGKTVSVSFDIKGSIASSTVLSYPYQDSGITITNSRNHTITTQWTRVTLTDVVKQNAIGSGMTTGGIGVYDTANAGQNLDIRNIKIELGNRPTLWTPSAKDVTDGDTAAVATAGTNADTKITNFNTSTVQPALAERPTTTIVDNKIATNLTSAKNYADTVSSNSANGVNKNYWATTAPVNGVLVDAANRTYISGDNWIQRDGTGKIVGQFEYANSQWYPRQINYQMIASIDVGNMTVLGRLKANNIDVSLGGGNALKDSSFEAGGGGLSPSWAKVGTVNIFKNGNGSLPFSTASIALDSGTNDSHVVAASGVNRPTFMGGVKVTLSAWVYKTAGAVSSFGTRLLCGQTDTNFYDGSGAVGAGALTLADGFTPVNFNTLPTDVWTRVRMTITTTAQTQVHPRLYASANTNRVYWDNVQVEEGEIATSYSPRPDEILPGTIKGEYLEANTSVITNLNIGPGGTIRSSNYSTTGGASGYQISETGIILKTGTIDLGSMTVAGTLKAANIDVTAGGGNMIANSNFDNGLVGWASRQGGTVNISVVDNTDIVGSKAVQILAPSAAQDMGIAAYQEFQVTPGEKLVASAWVKALQVGSGQALRLGVEFFGPTGTYAGGDYEVVSTPLNTWNRVVNYVTIPAGVFKVNIMVYTGTSVAGDKYLVKAFQLERGELVSGYGPKPDEILPGTIRGEHLQADTSLIRALNIGSGGYIQSSNYVSSGGASGYKITDTGITLRSGTIDVGAMTVIGSLKAANIDASTLSIGQSQIPNLTNDLNARPTATTVNNQIAAVELSAEKGVNEAQAFNLNSTFADWTGSWPLYFDAWSGTAPIKETALVRTGAFAARWNNTGTTDQGMNALQSLSAHPYAPYVTVEIDFYLVAGGSLSGAGALLDWTPGGRTLFKLTDSFPGTVATGKWYRATRVIKNPGTGTVNNSWLMANYGELGALTNKSIIFDKYVVRPATAQEITSYETPTLISTAETNATNNGAAGGLLAVKNLWGHPANNTFIDGSDVYTGTINARAINIGDFTNYVADGDLMDSTFSNWEPGLNRVAAVNGQTPPYMYWLTSGVAGNNTHVYNKYRFETRPGDSYYFEFEYSTPASNTAGVNLYSSIQADNATGNVTQWAQVHIGLIPANTAWTKTSGYINVTGADSVSGRFDPFANSSAIGQEIRMRRMVLRKRNAGELLVDGAITARTMNADVFNGKEFNVLNGGGIRSALYTSSGGTQGFRLTDAGLIIKSGSVDANLLAANTTITTNLGVTGLLTVSSSGGIQSNNYSAGVAGFKIYNNGIEINGTGSSVKADAIKTGILGGPDGAGVIQIAYNTTLLMNGGSIKSNAYAGNSYNPAATSGFYIGTDGFHVATGDVSANAFTGGTFNAGTIIVGAAGAIQSTNYNNTNRTGWRMSSSGLDLFDGSINARALNVSIGGSNMLTNSGFQNTVYNGADWTIGGAGIGFNANWVHSGDRSAFAPEGVPIYRDVAVTQGRKYTVSVWSYSESNNARLVIHDTAGGQLQTAYIGAPGTTSRAILNYTANATGQIRIHGYGQAYFDDFQLEEGDIATAYSPKADEVLPGTIQGNMVKANTVDAGILMAGTAINQNLNVVSELVMGSGALPNSGVMRSWNYSQASAGWKIQADSGAAEFNNVTVRGNIQGNSSTKITGGVLVGSEYKTSDVAFGSVVASGLRINSSGIKAWNNSTGEYLNIASDAIHLAGSLNLYGGGNLNMQGGNINVNSGYIRGGANTSTASASASGVGYIMDQNGLYIGNGRIEAAALRLQAGASNMIPAQWSSYEMPPSYYTLGAIPGPASGSVSLSSAQKYQGTQSLRYNVSSNNADYSEYQPQAFIPVEPNKRYIVSMYVYQEGGTANDTSLLAVIDGTGTGGGYRGPNEGNLVISTINAWRRYSWTFTAGASETAVRVYPRVHFQTASTKTNRVYYVDAVMMEERMTESTTPSAYVLSGLTEVSGSMINTGTIRSTALTTIDGIPNQPVWSIGVNDTGAAHFANLRVLGNSVLGNSTNDTSSSLQSGNYQANVQGWRITSDGMAEFGNAVMRGSMSTAAPGLARMEVTQVGGKGRINMHSGTATNIEIEPGTIQMNSYNQNTVSESNGIIIRPATLMNSAMNNVVQIPYIQITTQSRNQGISRSTIHLKAGDIRFDNFDTTDYMVIRQGSINTYNNAGADIPFNIKRLIVSSTEPANQNANNQPPLIIGDPTATHLRMDNDGLVSMSGQTGRKSFTIAATNALFNIDNGYAVIDSGSNVLAKFRTSAANGGTALVLKNNQIVAAVEGYNAVGNTASNTVSFHAADIHSWTGGIFMEDTAQSTGTTATINQFGRIIRTGSSIKYKKYVKPMSLEEASVALDLEAVTFQWKSNMDMGEGRVPGFIAEQADEVGADLYVTRHSDDTPQGFRYAELTAAHNVLVKDLYEKNAALEEKLARLEELVASLVN